MVTLGVVGSGGFIICDDWGVGDTVVSAVRVLVTQW